VAVEFKGWKAVAVAVDPTGALRMFPRDMIRGDNDDPLYKFIPKIIKPRAIKVMIKNRKRLFWIMIVYGPCSAR
jgi:hypothetical protein